MKQFHRLQVQSATRETDAAVVIVFNVPPALQAVFQFIQGQNLTVRATIGDVSVRRNYSICTAPRSGVLAIAVKRVLGGVFSTWAFEKLQAGDWLEVLPPAGSFYTPLHAENKKNYVAVAAGSGITPLLSIITATLQTEAHSTFTLVYGNQSKRTILFKETLEALKDTYLSRFRVIHVLSRERTEADLNSGRIDAAKCAQLFQTLIPLPRTDEVFVCGPSDLIFCVRDFLLAAGFPKANIHFELFGVPGQAPVTGATQAALQSSTGPMAAVQVTVDGVSFQFELAQTGPSILEAALAQGADLPYACKGGVCCTCKARLRAGAVRMDVVWGLEQDEIEAGFILTCQSHPTTDTVVVDFDVT